ncbi:MULTISPECIES: dihydrofolate reductase [Clostridium]|uniref:dihydrofolate reductase n=1 Tax=Clostridium senegalense TaxID=1465809 RepID=A0A6M0H1A1_9CLOT|nr:MULTISPECIES: dihydrofolate reductase [Clostridium]NEU03651.1 dihydrofolate reductase [Clostridium senegalense]
MNIIVAVDENYGIGCKGNLLVNIREDLKFFKDTTIGKVVVMGRKTRESLPNMEPLKDRVNIVITKQKGYKADGFFIVNSLEELFLTLKNYNSDDIFCIGGESIYSLLAPYCNYAYVTKIHEKYNSDKNFFDIDNNKNWKLIKKEKAMMSKENNIKFNFNIYENTKI